MSNHKTLAGICERCMYATETNIPCGLIENYLWCECLIGMTKPLRWCEKFLPKRKFNRQQIAFYVF